MSWINKYVRVRWLCNCLTCGMLNSDDEDDLERESSSSSSSSSNNRLSERSDGSHILSDDGSFLDEEAEVGDDGLFPHDMLRWSGHLIVFDASQKIKNRSLLEPLLFFYIYIRIQ